MSIDTTKRPTIPEPKLARIEQDAKYASMKSESHKDWYISRFEYNHGSLIAITNDGMRRLAIDCKGDIMLSNVTRAVWQLSPPITQELIRGYRLARDAGLLGD